MRDKSIIELKYKEWTMRNSVKTTPETRMDIIRNFTQELLLDTNVSLLKGIITELDTVHILSCPTCLKIFSPSRIGGKYCSRSCTPKNLSPPILQFNLEGELVRKWDTIQEIRVTKKCRHSDIQKVIGTSNVFRKSTWEYEK